MKTYVFISLTGLFFMSLLTSSKPVPAAEYTPVQQDELLNNNGTYFNPQKFYNKQCTFCHNDSGKIGPSMSTVKTAYLMAYPKKADFIKKMTAFVTNPTDENRLIKNNTGKYKVMPKGMFNDPEKIAKVAEYIYNNTSIKNIKAVEKLTKKEPEKNKEVVHVNVKLQLQKGADICNILNLRPVDFEFAKSTISPPMAKQLNNLVAFLKDNPNIKIEVRNHTDSRGSAKHNLNLSTKRANAIKRYLIGHGIKGTRIRAVGMGESQLLNRCKDNVPCSEEEHKQNRRTEIIIL